MPRKPAKNSETPAIPEKETTAKKTTRRKKTAEPVAEALVETANTAAETVADTPAPKKRGRKPKAAADAAVTDTTVTKKRGRKPKTAETPVPDAAAADAVVTDAPEKKKRGRKPKAEASAEAPVKKKRGRKKASPERIPELAPPIEAENTFEDAPVNVQPDMVVEIAEEMQAEQPVAKEAPAAESPAKKPRKPRAKKTDAAPRRRGRPPKEKAPELALITTLQIGTDEFDISGIAEKAYKEYKRVHKRKVVTDFHVYVKPEENAAYYTVNGEGSEEFKIELS